MNILDSFKENIDNLFLFGLCIIYDFAFFRITESARLGLLVATLGFYFIGRILFLSSASLLKRFKNLEISTVILLGVVEVTVFSLGITMFFRPEATGMFAVSLACIVVFLLLNVITVKRISSLKDTGSESLSWIDRVIFASVFSAELFATTLMYYFAYVCYTLFMAESPSMEKALMSISVTLLVAMVIFLVYAIFFHIRMTLQMKPFNRKKIQHKALILALNLIAASLIGI